MYSSALQKWLSAIMQPKHISFDNFSPFIAGSISIHMSLLVLQSSSKVKFSNSVLLGSLKTENHNIKTAKTTDKITIAINILFNFISPPMKHQYSRHMGVLISIPELHL